MAETMRTSEGPIRPMLYSLLIELRTRGAISSGPHWDAEYCPDGQDYFPRLNARGCQAIQELLTAGVVQPGLLWDAFLTRNPELAPGKEEGNG